MLAHDTQVDYVERVNFKISVRSYGKHIESISCPRLHRYDTGPAAARGCDWAS